MLDFEFGFYVLGRRPGAELPIAAFDSFDDAREWMDAHPADSRGFDCWVVHDDTIRQDFAEFCKARHARAAKHDN